MAIYKVTVSKPSKESKMGIGITRLVVTKDKNNSGLRVGDCIITVNGVRPANNTEAVTIMREAVGHVLFVIHRPLELKSLVNTEFKGWTKTWQGPNKCVVEPQDNPSKFAASLAPGLCQEYRYQLVFKGNRVFHTDLMVGKFNRMCGGVVAMNGNSSQVQAVSRKNDIVVQKCSRMEALMIAERSKYESYVNALEAAKSQNAAGKENTAPNNCQKKNNIANQLKELKLLRSDGTLTEDEFEKAKAKLLA